MAPTLLPGDYIITRSGKPQRFDLIVFPNPRQPSMRLVKRVVGLPGDTIEVSAGGGITVDGKPLSHPALFDESPVEGRWTIHSDEVFVIGDALHGSTDSRSFGPVPISNRVDRVWRRYWPPGRAGRIG